MKIVRTCFSKSIFHSIFINNSPFSFSLNTYSRCYYHVFIGNGKCLSVFVEYKLTAASWEFIEKKIGFCVQTIVYYMLMKSNHLTVEYPPSILTANAAVARFIRSASYYPGNSSSRHHAPSRTYFTDCIVHLYPPRIIADRNRYAGFSSFERVERDA